MFRPLLILALLTSACFADVFVVTSRGMWKSSVADDGPQPWVKVITFSDTDTVVNGCGAPRDDDDGGGGDATITEKVATISRNTLRNDKEATAVVSVIRVFRRPDVDLSKARAGLAAAINVLKSSPIFPDNKFSEWLAQIESLQPGQYTALFLASVEQGILKAFPQLKPGKLYNDDDVQKINIIEIIELIRIIIELLRDLGIIGGSDAVALDTRTIPLGFLPLRDRADQLLGVRR